MSIENFENKYDFNNFEDEIKPLLNNANDWFIYAVMDIENCEDVDKKAKIAEKYIKESNSIAEIDFETLINYLKNINSIPLSLCRQLYLLERSIPRRKANNHNYQNQSWIDRLKIFADTYALENSLAGKIILDKPKLYFSHNSGDHTALHVGKGSFGTDFCYWLQYQAKPVFVEFKHWGSSDIIAAADYYSNKIYGAKDVIIFTCDHKYYWITYGDELKIEEITNVSVPELLYW